MEININDLFLWIDEADLYNFADDNTLSALANSIPELIRILENKSEKAIKWFDENDMSPNAKKFQGMILNKNGCITNFMISKLEDLPSNQKLSF